MSAENAIGIRAEGVRRTFGSTVALDNVSIFVPPGAFCTLLGASGSGKSTMLRLLAGLDRPETGEIWIGDTLVASAKTFVPPEKRRIGFVFQAYALWPHMNVFDQVAYPLRMQKLGKARIAEAVHKMAATVGLADLIHRYPSQLSGGQQQRVALARALVVEPSVLLLDEPLSNLDTALRQQMRQELQDLQRRIQVTTVYVTHDQEEAMAVSDLVVVMKNGRVVETGTPHQVYEHPKALHTAAFVGSSIIVPGRIDAADKLSASLRLDDGSVIQARTEEELTAGSLGALVVKPTDLEVVTDATGANLLHGEIIATTYLGSAVELRLMLAGRRVSMRTDRFTDYAAGQRVALRVNQNLATILPAAEEE